MTKNVVLIGFMGTGKTSTGKKLAEKLGCAFVDLDQYIEEQEGRSIPQIFAEQGEAHFRALEKQAVLDVTKRSNLVIATGGGTVKDADNMEKLQNWGKVICLTADVDTILQRTARRGSRPVLDGQDQGDRRKAVEELLQSRAGLYIHADCTIDTGDIGPLQIVEEICGFLRREGVLHA